MNLVDASFPNSIILAISSEHAQYDADSNTMTIEDKDDVAKVLDGQHRIAGLRHFERPRADFAVSSMARPGARGQKLGAENTGAFDGSGHCFRCVPAGEISHDPP